MDRLIVKNFGPLKDVDIELNKINIFIGENGSGKSVLGKLITIVLNTMMHENIDEKIKQDFKNYNIDFIENISYIEYVAQNKTSFILKNNEFKSNLHSPLVLTGKMHRDEYNETLKDIEKVKLFNDELEENMGNPIRELEQAIFSLKEFKPDDKKTLSMISTAEKLLRSMKEEMHEKVAIVDNSKSSLEDLSYLHEKAFSVFNIVITSQYIPAERNLISLFNRYVTTFITADIPLPKFLLNFSSEYTRAREEVQQLHFLNVEYQLKNGQEHIFYREEESLLLEQSSSGIQSALPLYLTVKYFAQKHNTIIIEEPEQNLFPKAQKETVEYIIENISSKNTLFMMTHSPYILTALNNLILANDVKEQKGVEAIKGIVKEEQCVAFEDVSAYSLVDGKTIDIMDKEDRLIGVNLIDSISDEVSNTFDTLLTKLD